MAEGNYFDNLMNDKLFNMGLALMSQWKTPPGQMPSLGAAMQQYNGWQQNQQANTLNQLNLDSARRKAEKEKKDQELRDKLSGLPAQFTKPALQGSLAQGKLGPGIGIESDQGKMLQDQMQGGTLADLMALNQSANYTQQGTAQEMPLQDKPAQTDIAGLLQAAAPYRMQLGKPEDYFAGLEEKQKEQQKSQQWDDYIRNLEQSNSLPKGAIALMKGGPEIFGKVGPGVMPALMEDKEKKPVEFQQGRNKFKVIPDMEPEQAQALGLRYIPGVGAIAKGDVDKPASMTLSVPDPVTPVTIQDPKNPDETIIIDGRTRQVLGKGPKLTDLGKANSKRVNNMQGLGGVISKAKDILNGIERDEEGNIVSTSKPKPTQSGVGSALDWSAALVGKSPEGAEEAEQLRAIGGALTSAMPRMEGPQGVLDVKLYQEMAGQVGNSSLPVARRKAALETVERLWQKYDKQQEKTPSGGDKTERAPSVMNADKQQMYKQFKKAYESTNDPETRRKLNEEAKRRGVIK